MKDAIAFVRYKETSAIPGCLDETQPEDRNRQRLYRFIPWKLYVESAQYLMASPDPLTSRKYDT